MLGDFAGDGVENPADAAEVVFDEAVGDAVLEEGVGGVAGAVEKMERTLPLPSRLGHGLGAVAVEEGLGGLAVDGGEATGGVEAS